MVTHVSNDYKLNEVLLEEVTKPWRFWLGVGIVQCIDKTLAKNIIEIVVLLVIPFLLIYKAQISQKPFKQFLR